MRRTFTSLALALALAVMMVAPASANHVSFSDVSNGGTHGGNIYDLAHIDVARALSGTSFFPNNATTRSQASDLLARELDYKMPGWRSGGPSFSDTGSLPFATRANIRDLAGIGVLAGYPDGTFRPNNSITRAQAAVVVYRQHLHANFNIPPASVGHCPVTQHFSDVPLTMNASEAIYQLYCGNFSHQEKIVNGYADGTFRPNNTITRAQFSTIMARENDRHFTIRSQTWRS